ncbi:MAG: 6-hydroxymethylpterin diphosphokinase MptE-like protein [Promethearchaeia archaeon]
MSNIDKKYTSKKMKKRPAKSREYADLLNNFSAFKETYYQIVQDFNFDQQKDKEAQKYLNRLLEKKGKDWDREKIIHAFHHQIQKKPVICIFGAGPSLESCINKLIQTSHKNIFKYTINLAADGGSVFLRKKKIFLDGIFTDLDGITSKEFRYGTYLIVHAHGDNTEKLRMFKEEIRKKHKIIGTGQVKAEHLIINPGGFTDGDRIIFFLKNLLLPSQKICFFGMDFGSSVGKYSKSEFHTDKKANKIKKKKLHYARLLIKRVIDEIPNQCYFVEPKKRLEEFSAITIEDFIKLVKKSKEYTLNQD